MNLPRIEVHPEIAEASDRAMIEAQAHRIIGDPQQLRELDVWGEWTQNSFSDVARMFRNVEAAFAELSKLPAGQPAISGILQAVVNLRRTCLDQARAMAEDE